jgi:hypothetical protein
MKKNQKNPQIEPDPLIPVIQPIPPEIVPEIVPDSPVQIPNPEIAPVTNPEIEPIEEIE